MSGDAEWFMDYRNADGSAVEMCGNGIRVFARFLVDERWAEPGAYAVPAVQLGLALDRPVLDERIAARVDRMWEGGLVDEVRRLAGAGLREGRTASRALGYAQVLRHLEGEWTEQRARDETVRATRRFARRQESWFRRDPRVVWLDAGSPGLVGRALAVAGSDTGSVTD